MQGLQKLNMVCVSGLPSDLFGHLHPSIQSVKMDDCTLQGGEEGGDDDTELDLGLLGHLEHLRELTIESLSYTPTLINPHKLPSCIETLTIYLSGEITKETLPLDRFPGFTSLCVATYSGCFHLSTLSKADASLRNVSCP
jgi:hypothetical protein